MPPSDFSTSALRVSLRSVAEEQAGADLPPSEQAPQEREPTPPLSSEPEKPVTAEFEILEAGLEREVESTTSENPRDLLSDEQLDDHLRSLESVARARERADSGEEHQSRGRFDVRTRS